MRPRVTEGELAPLTPACAKRNRTVDHETPPKKHQ